MRRLIVSRGDVFYKFPSVEPQLRKRIGYHTPSTHAIDSFEYDPLNLAKPVVVTGARGIGETAYALAHGEHVLVARRFDDLRRINYYTDVVVWENVSFSNVAFAEVIALLSQDTARSFSPSSKSRSIWLDPHIKIIFTTSQPSTMVDGVQHASVFPTSSDAEEMRALRSRYIIALVEAPMF